MIDPHSALINLHFFCLVCSFSLFFFLGGGGGSGRADFSPVFK